MLFAGETIFKIGQIWQSCKQIKQIFDCHMHPMAHSFCIFLLRGAELARLLAYNGQKLFNKCCYVHKQINLTLLL